MLRGRIVRTAMAELAPRIMRKTLHPQSKITDFEGITMAQMDVI